MKKRLGYKDGTRPEHMFNMLNRWIKEGKDSPMVCKFLDSLSAFFHGIHPFSGRPCYLLEEMELTDGTFPPFGFRTAFLICQPGLNRIRSGKD
jgi:hypothetical protein